MNIRDLKEPNIALVNEYLDKFEGDPQVSTTDKAISQLVH